MDWAAINKVMLRDVKGTSERYTQIVVFVKKANLSSLSKRGVQQVTL